MELLTTALQSVLEERRSQDAKWGEQNHIPFIWLGILTEEVGETSEAMLHETFGGPKAENIRKEAVQVAAVALAIVEYLDRRDFLGPGDVVTSGAQTTDGGRA